MTRFPQIEAPESRRNTTGGFFVGNHTKSLKERIVNEIYSRGRCSTSGQSELFFSEVPTDLAAAQSLCGECEVRVKCLEYALENAIEWGVWGGVIFWDGQALYRKRGRGRPKLAEAHLPLEASREELQALVRSA